MNNIILSKDSDSFIDLYKKNILKTDLGNLAFFLGDFSKISGEKSKEGTKVGGSVGFGLTFPVGNSTSVEWSAPAAEPPPLTGFAAHTFNFGIENHQPTQIIEEKFNLHTAASVVASVLKDDDWWYSISAMIGINEPTIDSFEFEPFTSYWYKILDIFGVVYFITPWCLVCLRIHKLCSQKLYFCYLQCLFFVLLHFLKKAAVKQKNKKSY